MYSGRNTKYYGIYYSNKKRNWKLYKNSSYQGGEKMILEKRLETSRMSLKSKAKYAVLCALKWPY